jgi:hypothetical protein
MNPGNATAEDILMAMAYKREDFKNKVGEKVGGALFEYYKATLASSSGQTRWVQHWRAEVQRLVETELVIVLLHPIRGFKDRKKAAREMIEEIRAIDAQYRRAAEQTIRHDYGLKKLRGRITAEDAEQFYRMVQRIVDTHT